MSLGATVLAGGSGVEFKVWAPEAHQVSVCLYLPDERTENEAPLSPRSSSPLALTPVETIALKKDEVTGIHSSIVSSAKSRWRYKFIIDEKGPFPDPTSRFQPLGVHGPSEVVDASEYKWRDTNWRGIVTTGDIVIYELHVGTFTPEGTWLSALEKLPHLLELGIKVIEVMPVSDFAGSRNWGYDGVCLYSPSRSYGRPEDFRLFVDTCHEKGIAILLDVVYNHFGPDGNYLSCYSPHYFTTTHQTPWGPALNVDLSTSSKDTLHAPHVRQFLISNAVYWLKEFHIDGLRLDATHTIIDLSSPHILQELALTCKSLRPNFRIYAEDERNTTKLLTTWGLDGAWADDYHHQIRVCVAGDNESYFQNFSGTSTDISKTIKTGWYYIGQSSKTEGTFRGEDPSRVVDDMSKFVVCVQNHDQVGNRPFGDRIHHKIEIDSYRAISSLLLLGPETPLLFMGQEWATSSPFQFFTDHHEQLGKLVTEGRRKEFAKFIAFNDPQTREKIPDPQAQSTFENSKLNWGELQQSKAFLQSESNSTVTGTQEPLVDHWQTFELYQALIKLRSTIPALSSVLRSEFDCFTVIGDQVIALVRTSPTSISSQTSSSSSTTDGNSYIILSLLSNPRDTQQVKVSINDLRARTSLLTSGSRWELIFSSSPATRTGGDGGLAGGTLTSGSLVGFDSEYKEITFQGPATVLVKVAAGVVQRR